MADRGALFFYVAKYVEGKNDRGSFSFIFSMYFNIFDL